MERLWYCLPLLLLSAAAAAADPAWRVAIVDREPPCLDVPPDSRCYATTPPAVEFTLRPGERRILVLAAGATAGAPVVVEVGAIFVPLAVPVPAAIALSVHLERIDGRLELGLGGSDGPLLRRPLEPGRWLRFDAPAPGVDALWLRAEPP